MKSNPYTIDMKRLLLAIIMLLPLWACAQSDSLAIHIVDRYLRIMNVDALPADSMLVATTEIVYPTTGDTFTMQRYYAPPQMFRIEVRQSDGSLETGLYGNGDGVYRAYSERHKQWVGVTRESYFSRLGGFDLRGPLYNWRSDNAYLTYRGQAEFKGQKLDAVHYSAPGFFGRLYLFEPSGLLSAIIEDDTVDDGYNALLDAHIDWKVIHEYDHVGPALLPTVESFMRQQILTVLRTRMHFEKRDDSIFNND